MVFLKILIFKHVKITFIFILSKKHFKQNVVLCFGNMYSLIFFIFRSFFFNLHENEEHFYITIIEKNDVQLMP